MIDRYLPPRSFLLLILIFSLINPIQYAVMVLTAPENRVFMGYIDDSLQLALMKSVIWDFKSPWDLGISVFENPFLGASYAFVFLGTIPALLNMDIFFVYMIIKFILSVFYLILVYNLMRYFLDSERKLNLGYALFLFSAGIGAFIYGFFMLTYPDYAPVVGYALTNEFDELGGGVQAVSHLTRIYWLLPEITGLISLLFFIKGRHAVSGLFLGLTILFYPTFALAFAFLIVIYFITANYRNRLLENGIKKLLPVIAVSAVFAVPWLLNYFQYPSYFNQYRAWFSGLPLTTLAISFFFTLMLSVYGFYVSTRSLLKKKIYVLLLAVSGLLSSLIHLYEFSGGSRLLREWMSAVGVFGFSAFLYSNFSAIDLFLVLLFVLLFLDILRNSMSEKQKFIALWIVAMIPITVVSAKFVFWWPARMRWFLLIPLCIASMSGVERLSKIKLMFFNRKIKDAAIVLAVILLSIPSIIAFSVYIQQVAHSSGIVYVSENDYNALKFLKTQPDGRVLSLHQIGSNIPFFTDKEALLFNEAGDEKAKDAATFYSDSSLEEKITVLKKYRIEYVFYGENEIQPGTGLDNLPYLENIYDHGTKIYRVRF